MGDEGFKKADRTNLLIDFQNRMRSGDVKSVDGYVDLLEQKGYAKHAMTVTVNNDGFERVVERLQR